MWGNRVRPRDRRGFPKTGLNVEITSDLYRKAAVTQDAQELQEKVTTLNAALQKYKGVSVTYTFGKETQVLDNATICSWLVISDESVSVDTAQRRSISRILPQNTILSTGHVPSRLQAVK